MEFSSYLGVLLLGFLVVLLRSRTALYLLFLPAYAGFLVVSRNAGFDVDLKKFVTWFGTDFVGFAVYREYLFFLLGRTFYAWTGDEIQTVLLMDLVWLVALLFGLGQWRAQNKIPDAMYVTAAVTLLMSFMFLMGTQNFYRQHMAVVMAATAYCCLPRRWLLAGILALAGILFHNSAALLAPVLFARFAQRFGIETSFLGALFWTGLACLGLTALAAGGLDASKSNASTGLNLTWIYLCLFATLFFVSALMYRLNLARAYVDNPSSLIGLIIVFVMAIGFQDAPAERVGILFLVLAVPDLALTFSRLPPRDHVPLSVLTVLIFSVPAVAFSNARQFLLTFAG